MSSLKKKYVIVRTSHPSAFFVGEYGYVLRDPIRVQAAQEYTVAEYRQKIMDEAAEALMGLTLTPTEAMRVVSAIADGEIPHVEIHY
jgi:hypothetical protein